ncbi:MAG: shikimate dehydrogenase [Bacterioplanes sp.]|nr:shikimate dehydrogenase [Bacterioplanes sp.]
MTDLYAVAGNPISHSKSPLIHSAFARQTQQDMLYKAQLMPLDGFALKAGKFFEHGGSGLNVTVPFKEDAYRFADEWTPRARRAQAVNTLKKLENGRILADNTDGVGLVRDLTLNHHLSLTGKRILLLGAGGAVRGVLQPLLEQQPAELVIANRTLSKAQQLALDFADLGVVIGCGFEAVEGAFDLIINGTSASLGGECPPIPASALKADTVTYDMMYGAGRTVFNQWAHEQGVTITLDGLGMLVEQAGEAFYLWRGVRPDTAAVVDTLRRERRV